MVKARAQVCWPWGAHCAQEQTPPCSPFRPIQEPGLLHQLPKTPEGVRSGRKHQVGLRYSVSGL